jgi:hypothetical protein
MAARTAPWLLQEVEKARKLEEGKKKLEAFRKKKELLERQKAEKAAAAKSEVRSRLQPCRRAPSDKCFAARCYGRWALHWTPAAPAGSGFRSHARAKAAGRPE